MARDDVHHATQRFAAIEHREGPAHDLDALDVLDGDPVVLEIRVPNDAVAGAHATAIDQKQGVLAVEAAQADHLPAANRAALQADADLAPDRGKHVVGAAHFDIATGHHGEGSGRVDYRHLSLIHI